MQTILDSSFIITAVKQKIDFFEQLELEGFKILIPKQVIAEIKRLSEKNSNAKLSLKIIEKNKSRFFPIDLGTGHVDKKIVQYTKAQPETYVATLDQELKSKVKKKVFIRGKKKIEFF